MSAPSAAARPPAVAGAFYEASGERLARQLEACFLDRRGPGALPTRRRRATRRIRAAIVPHAGLLYSGAIAARAFHAIAADAPAPAVLLLGVDHHALGRSFALSARPWQTPLGRVAPASGLIKALEHPPIAVDEAAHQAEHSIEVELPFLQYVEPACTIAPLMVRHAPLDTLRTVAREVRRAIDGRDVLLIASTDFSHYVPAGTAERLDRLAIDRILARDGPGLYETVSDRGISMCGIAPTTVLLLALEGEPLTARLLAWGHSGEVEPMREVVGYASLVLERNEAPED
jgi:MEMO1 family protein